MDGLHSSGKLDELGISKGPIFWVDSADSQPCVGTVGNMQWMMKATGKLFHSGLPHMVRLLGRKTFRARCLVIRRHGWC